MISIPVVIGSDEGADHIPVDPVPSRHPAFAISALAYAAEQYDGPSLIGGPMKRIRRQIASRWGLAAPANCQIWSSLFRLAAMPSDEPTTRYICH